MQIFKFPVTLTIVQFAFISAYCLLLGSPLVGFAKLRKPTAAIIRTTLPMAAFQVGGHISSSMAISRIPVSTVHTIKALSPLFTVAAYAMLFGVKYSATTYLSLLPLTIGVMLSCSFDMASNPLGLLCAFGSAIIFVSSNIFFKKIMPTKTAGSAPTTHRLDKMNLLFYSSGLAFLLMIPIWLYYDLFPLLNRWSSGSIQAVNRHAGPSGHSVAYYFFANGTVHFLQNVIAFAILATTSPVTYSIASLIKRIAVICIAIVWFNQSVHPVQGFGIFLTFGGLYLYNKAKGDVDRGEKMVQRVEAMRELVLPSTKEEVSLLNAEESSSSSYPIRSSFTTVQHRNAPSHAHTDSTVTITGAPTPAMVTTIPAPRRNSHVRTMSRENPMHIPAPLNTTLASRSYASKYVPVFSPPLSEVNPNSAIGGKVDPYPSPPRSLDSPPPELDDLIKPVGISNSNDSGTTRKIWNRKGTNANSVSVH